jgi:hypothetical protein
MAELDVSAELSKAVIGTAVNMLVPGVGSLAVAGIQDLTRQSLNQQIADALERSLKAIEKPPDVPKLALVRKFKGWRRNRKARKVLASKVPFAAVMAAAQKQFEGAHEIGKDAIKAAGEVSTSSPPVSSGSDDSEKVDWAGFARDQLFLALAPVPTPGSWRDEFSDHLEAMAIAGLDDLEYIDRWTLLINAGPKPERTEVAEWSDLVTRVFAAEWSASRTLKPYFDQLEQHDQRAYQEAELWQRDAQRRSLNFIALALLAIALEYGLHLSPVA